MFSRFIHTVACSSTLFQFIDEYYSIDGIDIAHLFIHSSVDGDLGCFHLMAIVNTAAIKIHVHFLNLFLLFEYSCLHFPAHVPIFV